MSVKCNIYVTQWDNMKWKIKTNIILKRTVKGTIKTNIWHTLKYIKRHVNIEERVQQKGAINKNIFKLCKEKKRYNIFYQDNVLDQNLFF